MIAVAFLAASLAAQPCANGLASTVPATIEALRREHDIPGMAVALSFRGQRHFFSSGIASRQTRRAVTEDTVFEVGSISKLFTATLGAHAEALGKLRLDAPASRYWPELAGPVFDQIPLRDLATYTPGGLPLQFPAEVVTPQDMVTYYRNWRPDHPSGAFRRYSNPSIGLFGYLTARSFGQPFDQLMERTLFPLLGLRDTYIHVPPDKDYAHGYTADGRQVRVEPGVLDSEAYGVKTTARDLITFAERVLDPRSAAQRRAFATTRRGYYRVGGMTQGLGWEMYDWPTPLDTLLAGNSPDMALKAHRTQPFTPPLPPRDEVWMNKTGSTNGFGAYIAVAPARRMAIVVLANKNYPNTARVRAAHGILAELDKSCAQR